jgi:acid phosphatase (class A)
MKHLLLIIIALRGLSLARAQSVSTPRAPGYLIATQIAGVEKIVPPAPSMGDPRYRADMAVFHETRSLAGSPRWKLAQSDDNLSIAGLLHAFQCSLGLDLTPERAPKLANLLSRSYSDAGAASNTIKFRYGHKRPFQVGEGDVCVSPDAKAALERSPDYPSGHATLSWEAGLILAELVPESADGVLARARAFGQSRVVCGVHNLSAVEAGWMTASAVFAVEQSSAAFRVDLEAARSEIAAFRAASKTRPQGCEAEAETLSQSPY